MHLYMCITEQSTHYTAHHTVLHKVVQAVSLDTKNYVIVLFIEKFCEKQSLFSA